MPSVDQAPRDPYALREIGYARQNAKKIGDLMRAGERGYADLFRTIRSGPSGQRYDLCVGRVWYQPDGPDEFRVVDPSTGDTAGFARRTVFGEWSMTSYDDYDGHRWIGYASSLSVGCDVLVNGAHAANGRHDSERISHGYIQKGHEDPSKRKAAL